jgi:hypothetical protein
MTLALLTMSQQEIDRAEWMLRVSSARKLEAPGRHPERVF